MRVRSCAPTAAAFFSRRLRPCPLIVCGVDAVLLSQMRQLVGQYGVGITEKDLISHAQYPKVFKVTKV